MAKILIIDDEEQLRKLLARIIGLEGYEVAEAADCAEGLRMLRRCEPDVVLCDVKLPDGNGVEMVGRIKQAMPSAEVILLTAYGNIPDGVQAIKNGAFDYITKGDDNNKILPLLSRATEKAQMQRRLARLEDKLFEEHSFDRIIGSSEALRSAVALARKVAVTDTSVLLTGETGTGKEVFAQAIHHASPRAKGAFVAVNCSSFSKELLESELFGHRAGSFTGATKDKKGLFEEADKGTLFLDEIGEMPVELQAKLLRVLECGEFIKIGETRPTKVDLRIIAATNRDLEKEIASGNFREDLFFRLSVFRIHLPSLRERPGDIAEYARFFAAQFADRMGRRIDTIDKGYIAALERHAWHGNVRELRNVVERSLIMAEGNALTVGCLSPEFHAASCDGSVPDSMALDALERHHILRVLEYTKGNKAEAARLLGIGIATLYRKIDEYGIGNLQQTIDTHNAHAKAGEEDEFGRKDLPLINTHGGIWVCPCIPTFYLTTGGLAIDPSCHVLTEDREPIANLYAAGDVCGSIEEKDGRGYGYGFDAAMIYGYIMANTITTDLA